MVVSLEGEGKIAITHDNPLSEQIAAEVNKKIGPLRDTLVAASQVVPGINMPQELPQGNIV